MPFSAELGMNVYDPQQAYASGQPAGRTFAQSFQEAPQRQADQLKVKALRDEIADRAKETQLQQLGMIELQDAVASGTPFKDAFFKAAPKLFSRNPEALGRIMHNQALEEARTSYNESLANSRIANLELRANVAASDQERRSLGQQIDLLKLTLEKSKIESGVEAKRADQALREKDITAKTSMAKSRLMMAAQKDPELVKINQTLATAKTALADSLANPHWWKSKPENIRKGIAELEQQQAKRLKELGLENEIPTEEGRFGNDNMPDAGTAATNKPTVVRKRWENGQLVPVQ